MNPLRVAIVDDEPLARLRLRRLLGVHTQVSIVGEYENAQGLLLALPNLTIDLLFLDIEMPGLDGFSALRQIASPRPQIVFVTAYCEHAVGAFAVEALDYLVKPVSQQRLTATLERALRVATGNSGRSAATDAYPQRLALPIGRRMHLIDINSIDCVTAQANYIEIQSGARRFVLRRPLCAFEEQLDPALFLRIHRSSVVRVGAVAAIEPLPSGRYRLQLKNGVTMHSGRSYREQVRAAFGLDRE